MTKTKKLTLSAVMTAVALALILVSKQLPAPWTQGGYITLGSMVPIILVSVIIDTKWGIASGFVFSLIQLMTDFYLPPATTAFSFFGVIVLDYIVAFTVLGLAGFFARRMGNKIWSIALSGTIVTGMRYACHVLSGLLIWGAFSGSDCIPLYALMYNGSYMIPEMIITTVVLALIAPGIKKKFHI